MRKGNAHTIKNKGFDKHPENINKTGANGKSITKILKELLNEKIAEVEIKFIDSEGKEKLKKIKLQSKTEFNYVISTILFQKAMSGDLQAVREILDRTEGKPLQQMEIEQTEKVNLIIDSDLNEKINKIIND